MPETVPTKLAKLVTELEPHQRRVVERLQLGDQPGLLVAHGLGSGKTLTSIAAQEALGVPSTVVVPASLRENYRKEIAKHTEGDSLGRKIVSLQSLARDGAPAPNTDLLIVDEAHRLREPGTKSEKAIRGIGAAKRLLMTASPFYNAPSDIAPLVNIAAGKHLLPTAREDFRAKYVKELSVGPGLFNRISGVQPGVKEVIDPERAPELRRIFKQWVDYHPGSGEGFPDVIREDIPVDMTPGQLEVYDAVMRRAPPWAQQKVRQGLPPSKAEARDLNAFSAAVRQVSNSTRGFQPNKPPEEPKIDRAFEEMKKTLDANPRAKGVVYSNFLEAGVQPYREKLEREQIPFGEFTGAQKKSERDQMVRDYNEGKLRVLIVSSAGGEGLDLTGTRLVQVMEPHWNLEKIKQVEGRAIRFKSHEHLPENERNVTIQRYLSTRPASGFLEQWGLKNPGKGIDEYLATMSGEKERLIREFKELLPKEGSERSPKMTQKLREAMGDQKLVVIRYAKGDGKGTVLRAVEPYSFRPGALYAFDVASQKIKQFDPEKIKNVLRGDQIFEARWPVEPESDFGKTAEESQVPTSWTKGDPKREEAWSRAKERVRSHYPSAQEGSDRFYKLTMSIAENMVKEGALAATTIHKGLGILGGTAGSVLSGVAGMAAVGSPLLQLPKATAMAAQSLPTAARYLASPEFGEKLLKKLRLLPKSSPALSAKKASLVAYLAEKIEKRAIEGMEYGLLSGSMNAAATAGAAQAPAPMATPRPMGAITTPRTSAPQSAPIMPPASVKTGTEEKTKSRVVPALNLTSEQQKALKSLLFAANKDPELKGYVWPKKRGIEGRQAIVRDENVVGFASPRPSHTGEDVIRVGAIYVDPVHRGQGLASEAIRQIVKGKSGRAFIATDNEASRRAFEAAGFKPTQHETRWGGGDWFSKTSARPTSDRLAEKIAKGKASNCGLFIRIPSDLGKEFPKKEEDDSPPHVTLCYIGELNRAEITKATKAAREVLSDIAPFHVEMTDYGEFENPEGKTIAHMIPRAPELEPLHRRLGRALKDVGIEASRLGQPLKPHASLAYVEEGRKYDGPRPSGKWKVSEVEFWAGTDRSKIPLEGKSNSANNLVEKIAAMKLAAAGITGGPAPKQAPQAPQVQPSRKPIWPKARQQQQISPTPEALVRTSSKPSTRTKMTRKPITPLKDPIGEKQRALFPAKMLEDIPSKETGWRWRPDPRPPPLRSMTFTPSDWERRKQHLEDLRKDRVRTGLEREKRPPPTPRPIMTFTPAEWERRKNQLEAIRKERERLWRLPSRGPQFDPFDPDSGRAIGTGGPAKTAQEKSAAAGISGGPAPKQAPQPPAPTPLRKPIWPKARQTTVQRLSDVPSEAAGWRKAKPAPARPAIEERRDYMGETPAESQWERSRLEMLPFERELPPALGKSVPEPRRRSIFEPVPPPKPKTASLASAVAFAKCAISPEMVERALMGVKGQIQRMGIPVVKGPGFLTGTKKLTRHKSVPNVIMTESPAMRGKRGLSRAMSLLPPSASLEQAAKASDPPTTGAVLRHVAATNVAEQSTAKKLIPVSASGKEKELTNRLFLAHEKFEAQALRRHGPKGMAAGHADPSVISREQKLVRKLREKYPGFAQPVSDLRAAERQGIIQARGFVQETPSLLPAGAPKKWLESKSYRRHLEARPTEGAVRHVARTMGADPADIEKLGKRLGNSARPPSDDKPTFMIDLVRRRQGMRSKSPGAVVQRLARELAKQQS